MCILDFYSTKCELTVEAQIFAFESNYFLNVVWRILDLVLEMSLLTVTGL